MLGEICFIVTLATGVLVAYFVVKERHRDSVRFGGAVMGATGAALAAMFTYGQLQALERAQTFTETQHRDLVRHERQAVAFDLIRRFQQISGPEMHDLAKRLRPLSDEEKYPAIQENSEDTALIEKTLNFFEQMALAANTQHADEDVLCSYFRTIAPRSLKFLQPIVEKHRGRPARETSWWEFQTMVRRWKKGCGMSAQEQQFPVLVPLE